MKTENKSKDESSLLEVLRIPTLILVGGLTVMGLIGRGCNNTWNNKTINKPSYKTVSHATGISGHVEFTKYSNGSQDVKVYPGLGHRFWDSELHQDLDGDNKIDRIRRNGSELKFNSLRELLVRKDDYDLNKKKFDDADKQLQELNDKYDSLDGDYRE